MLYRGSCSKPAGLPSTLLRLASTSKSINVRVTLFISSCSPMLTSLGETLRLFPCYLMCVSVTLAGCTCWRVTQTSFVQVVFMCSKILCCIPLTCQIIFSWCWSSSELNNSNICTAKESLHALPWCPVPSSKGALLLPTLRHTPTAWGLGDLLLAWWSTSPFCQYISDFSDNFWAFLNVILMYVCTNIRQLGG